MKKIRTAQLQLIDKFLLSYAKTIDNLDMYTGPFFEAKIFTDSEIFHTVANIARTVEYSLKIPFIITYIARTKDYASLTEWVPKEIFAINFPYGGIIQLFRRYENRTKEYYKNKIV